MLTRNYPKPCHIIHLLPPFVKNVNFYGKPTNGRTRFKKYTERSLSRYLIRVRSIVVEARE